MIFLAFMHLTGFTASIHFIRASIPPPSSGSTGSPPFSVVRKHHTASRGRALYHPFREGGRDLAFKCEITFKNPLAKRPSHVGGDVGVGAPKPKFSGIRPRFLRLLQRWEDAD